jgi:hypothetical protein
MTWKFNSFNESTLKGFRESIMHARDAIAVTECPDKVEVELHRMSEDLCDQCRLLTTSAAYRTAIGNSLSIDGTYSLDYVDTVTFEGFVETCKYQGSSTEPTLTWSTYDDVNCTSKVGDWECKDFDFEVHLRADGVDAFKVWVLEISCDSSTTEPSAAGTSDCMCKIFTDLRDNVPLDERATNEDFCAQYSVNPVAARAAGSDALEGRVAVGNAKVNAI